MPTYEYACKDCGEHLEVVQSFKDDALTDCPSCTGELRKVFSAAGIIFKGSGWHIKDYKDGSSSKAASPPRTDSGSGDSASGSSSSDSSSSGSTDSSAKDSSTSSSSSTGESKSA